MTVSGAMVIISSVVEIIIGAGTILAGVRGKPSTAKRASVDRVRPDKATGEFTRRSVYR